MAVDIALVLQSEHRRIQQLVQRCGRTSRGFHDPAAELATTLRIHLDVANREVYPTAKVLTVRWPGDQLERVEAMVLSEDGTSEELIEAAEMLISAESEVVVPALLHGQDVPERRRLGKVFRLRRDAMARSMKGSHRRQPSQTELYELARRAGVEQRSKMTQAELQQAITTREANGR